MPTPSEHKTVQARILGYAEAIGWTIVPHEEAEQRRGFDPDVPPADRARNRSLFFDDLLDAKLREFNPRYAEAEGALLGQFRHLHTDIYGNREFVEHLRNRGKFFDHEEKRERDLILIDYDDPARNVFEVTEEWAFHDGHYGTRRLHTDIDLQPRLRGGLSRAPQRGRISDEKLSYATQKWVSRQSDCFFVAYKLLATYNRAHAEADPRTRA